MAYNKYKCQFVQQQELGMIYVLKDKKGRPECKASIVPKALAINTLSWVQWWVLLPQQNYGCYSV